LPVFIPAITLLLPGGSADSVKSQGVIASIIVAGSHMDSTVTEHIKTANVNSMILFGYLVIAAFLLFRSVFGVVKALRIIKKGRVIDGSFPRIVISGSKENLFSFFPFIVIPEELYNNAEYKEVVEHEKVHVRQLHTFDLLLSEFCISLQWFNPFIWFIKRSIVLNHEYLADSISIMRSQNKTEYQYKLLDLSVKSAEVCLTHSFSSSIKKRLIMINKKPTQNYAAIKGFLVIPVVAILFLFFAFKPETVSSGNRSDEPLFSKSSLVEIYKFLSTNLTYPDEARSACDTGSVYVLVKMGKGGVIKECKAISDPGSINTPLMDEIVIVGYKPASPSGNDETKDHLKLKAESLRVANELVTLNIPEWKDKNMAFVMKFTFTLK